VQLAQQARMPKTKSEFKIAATVILIGGPAPSWQKKTTTYKILMTNKIFTTTPNNIAKLPCPSSNTPIHQLQNIIIICTSITT
jgi:hypothetical protein